MKQIVNVTNIIKQDHKLHMINLSTSKKGIDNQKPWGFDQIQKKRFLSKFNNKYNHGN